jgi:ankyrin repeat protein
MPELQLEPDTNAAAVNGGAAYEQRQLVQSFLRAASEGDSESLRALAAALDDVAPLSAVVAAVRDGNGRGALHFAASRDQAALCRELAGLVDAALEQPDESGDTPLLLACRAGVSAAALALLECGADACASGEGGTQPVHLAAASGSPLLLSSLLQRGAAADAPSDAGPPLLWAAAEARLEALQVLLAAGASAQARTPQGVPALHVLASQPASQHAAAAYCASALLAAGAECDARCAAMGGLSALHVAADCGALALAEELLLAGCDADAAEEGGCTALALAAAQQDQAMVHLLLPRSTHDERVQPWTAEAVLAAAREGRFGPAAAAEEADGAEEENASKAEVVAAPPASAEECYRAGLALQAQGRYEEAAVAFFEGFQMAPESEYIALAFTEAVEQGRAQHREAAAETATQ